MEIIYFVFIYFRVEEACLLVLDELRQVSTRYGHHGRQHLRQGL